MLPPGTPIPVKRRVSTAAPLLAFGFLVAVAVAANHVAAFLWP